MRYLRIMIPGSQASPSQPDAEARGKGTTLRERARWAAVLLAVVVVAGWATSRASGQDCDVRGTVEQPPENALVTGNLVTITGWAADLGAPQGTGISSVRIALDADPEQGGTPLPALYGWERPDIATLLGGQRYLATGFAMNWDTTGLPAGTHTLYVQVRNACGWTGTQRTISLVAGAAPGPASAPPGGTAPAPSNVAPAGAAPPASAPAPSAPAPAPAAPAAPTAVRPPTQIVLPPSVPVSATSVPLPPDE